MDKLNKKIAEFAWTNILTFDLKDKEEVRRRINKITNHTHNFIENDKYLLIERVAQEVKQYDGNRKK